MYTMEMEHTLNMRYIVSAIYATVNRGHTWELLVPNGKTQKVILYLVYSAFRKPNCLYC